MKQDFFTKLPSEITINILSRLPVRTIVSCRCVCKPWLDLIKTDEFVNSHFSKSVPGLALLQDPRTSKPYKVLEFEETRNSARCNTLFEFSFPRAMQTHDSFNGLQSCNGLLFLFNKARHNLFFCNPVTREYIELGLPPRLRALASLPVLKIDTFGFGMSRVSGQYKVVMMFRQHYFNPYTYRYEAPTSCECEVYTLGTGSWRSVAGGGGPLWYQWRSSCSFLNGNLHWFVCEFGQNQPQMISCFDLETECVAALSLPRLDGSYGCTGLCALGDCLCLCHNSGDHFVIWSMKKCGDDKSWRKQFVIKNQWHGEVLLHAPLKILKNGDILFLNALGSTLCIYSSKTRNLRVIGISGSPFMVALSVEPTIYTPSFLPLKTFTMENVIPFSFSNFFFRVNLVQLFMLFSVYLN